ARRPFRFRAAAGADRAAPRAAAGLGAAAAGRGRADCRSWRTRPARPAAARRRAGVQRHQGHPGAVGRL
ncbi:MAG: S-adenosylmethionine:tRNA ribosyltransferase-isomerase, partial [uncultured Sphingomonas sp.]